VSFETGSKTKPFDQAWTRPWPQDGLEMLGACPICSSAERKILYDGLVDNVFFCAPGKWTMWCCSGCTSAYLDPRPSTHSIGLAYSSYYTHRTVPTSSKRVNYSSLNLWRKIRRQLFNGYKNWRYGTREEPALGIGAIAFMLAPPFRNLLDRRCRSLPRLPVRGGSVLDVGCGDGDFIEHAASLGWNAIGIDPDPAAIANCLSRGLDVSQGTLEQFADKERLFDVITLSHVIEHVHNPVALLKACRRLLKPTGQLWLETPNIDSLGHREYMKNWRGLEPPRHLVLFNRQSLGKALFASGFARIERRSGWNALIYLTRWSEAIKLGLPIEDEIQLYDIHLFSAQRWMLRKNRFMQSIFPSCKEVLTVVAFKSPHAVGAS
jgi:2-polyprenyl-3-methyl-5-hydroxy-6-metoxy-1,4-benzoquinol methylase